MGDNISLPLVVTLNSLADVGPAKAAAIACTTTAKAGAIEALTAAESAVLAGDVQLASECIEAVGQNVEWLMSAARTLKAANEFGQAKLEPVEAVQHVEVSPVLPVSDDASDVSQENLLGSEGTENPPKHGKKHR